MKARVKGWMRWAGFAAVLLAVFCAGFCRGIRWERERLARMYPDSVCDRCGRLECSAQTCRPEWEMKGIDE